MIYIYIYIYTSVDLSLYSDSVKWNGRLVVDRDVKRSVCFVYVFFLPYFRLMVGREVDGPVWAVLGRSWGLCGRSWPLLGLCWRSWAALGTNVGGLGLLLGP